MSLVSELGLSDEVKFFGSITEKEVVAEYGKAQVFVLSSEEEPAPQVIAQAMAAGLPVVSTSVGGIPFLVKDGQNGFLVPPGNVERLAEKIILNPER